MAPLTSYKVDIDRPSIEELDFRPDQLENISWKTAARLFRIDMEPASRPAPEGSGAR